MLDVLKGLSGGWAFLVSWVFPSILAWSLLALVAIPQLSDVPVFREVSDTSVANQSLVLVGASILTGILLSSLSTVLYRVLEGYILLPSFLSDKMRQRQERVLRQVRADVARLRKTRKEVKRTSNHAPITVPPSAVGIDLKIGLLNERLRKFPADPLQLGPTAFANALRAIETYGWDRYRLDSQTLWSELQGVIPERLKDDLEASRAPVNFFVSLIYLAALSGVIMLFLAVRASENAATYWILAAFLFASIPFWYRLAILNTRYLLATMQAAVNLGRVEVAKSMGLTLPPTLEEERNMWERMYWFVHDPFDREYIRDFDAYRHVSPDDSTSGR